jgi:transposase
MSMIGKVRRMHFRQGKSVREIARLTSLSRNTIRSWLREPEVKERSYRRPPAPTQLTPFAERLQQALTTDAHRPKRERRTALALFQELRAAGYAGCYSRVTDFVRAWRAGTGQASVRTAFAPLAFEWGEAYQFDWSEEGVVVGGVFYRAQVAHLTLCASRAFWLVAYPTQSHEMLFDAHTRSFAALGGVARRGIYDNMKTAVDKVRKGKGRVVNARFEAMCAHYLVDADFCNVASGWEKGVVEKNVQDARRRIFQAAAGERFASFSELNAWLAVRVKALWQELRHPQHRQCTVAELLEHERDHLMPMPAAFDGYVEKPARVSSTCLVVVAKNRYSVPCEFAGHWVSVRLYPQRVEVVADESVIAAHERLSNEGQTRYDWQHYVPLIQRKPGALRNGAPFADLPAPLQQLRRGLLREAGGDRAMAQILALVPQAGLDAVLVAVELALESGAPGRISLEHVTNVLGRLTATSAPHAIVTALQAAIPPLADPARYDRLRDAEVSHAS